MNWWLITFVLHLLILGAALMLGVGMTRAGAVIALWLVAVGVVGVVTEIRFRLGCRGAK